MFSGDGDLIPARVVEAPWLRRLQPLGEDVSVVLETADGTVRIEGETVLSTHDITDPSEIPADMLGLDGELDASRRCSRPACATRGTASRRSACSNARSRRIS